MPLIQLEKLRTILSTLDNNFELTQQQPHHQSKPAQLQVPQLEEDPPPPQQIPSSDATWAERYKAFRGHHLWKKKVTSNNNHDHENNSKENNDKISRNIAAAFASPALRVLASSSITTCRPSVQDSWPMQECSSGISNRGEHVPLIAVATRGAARRLYYRPVMVVTPPPVVVVTHGNDNMNDNDDDEDYCSLLKVEHAKRKDKLRNLVVELQLNHGDDFMSGNDHHHHDKMTTCHDEKALEILASLLMAKNNNNDTTTSDNHHHHVNDDGEYNENNLEELRRYKETLQVKLHQLQNESIQIDQDTQRILDWHELKVLSQQTLFKTPCHHHHHRPLLYHSYYSEEKRQDDSYKSNNNNNNNHEAASSSIKEMETPIMMTLPHHHHGKIRGNPQVIHYLINLVKQIDGDCTISSLVNNANNDDANTTTAAVNDADDNGIMMTLTVQLLKRHLVEISLRILNISTRNDSETTTTTINPHVHVRHAKFVTSTYLRGERNHQAMITTTTSTGNNHNCNEKKLPLSREIVLEIPPLDDLVQMANKAMMVMIPHQHHKNVHGLRLLLEETKIRIQTMQLRIRELSFIEKGGHAILAKIGPTTNTTTTTTCTNQQQSSVLAAAAAAVDEKSIVSSSTTTEFGTSVACVHHQRIVCILPDHHLRVVLLLSPECPCRAGSVTLDQLFILTAAAGGTTASDVDSGSSSSSICSARSTSISTTCTTTACSSSSGACFWESNSRSENEQILHDIRSKLSERRHEFASPVVLIQAIQRHVTEIKETVRRQRHLSNKERRKKQQEELVGASSSSTRRLTRHLPKRRIDDA